MAFHAILFLSWHRHALALRRRHTPAKRRQFAKSPIYVSSRKSAGAHLRFSPMRFEIGNNRNNWKKQRARTKGMLFQTVVSHDQKARR